MQYTRAKKIDRGRLIEQAIASRKITPEGADWLTLRLDPYHDFNKPVSGYPDADCYDTIVSAHNYEYNVTKPAGAAGDWDAHVFTLPSTYFSADNGTVAGGTFTAAASMPMGLVNIAKDDAGNPLFPTADPVVSANFSTTSVATFPEVENGFSRIIGMGIEIIDTTAELYKQGALTAYRMPAQNPETQLLGYINLAGTLNANPNVRVIDSPPSVVSEAVKYRGTVQWHAKEGAYMSVGQNGIENPFTAKNNSGILIVNGGEIANSQAVCSAVGSLMTLNAPPAISACACNISKNVNVTQSGIFLTGLANAATFKIRVRVYVERAPLKGDTSLIPLASPSAPYDPNTLELYSKLVTELPLCVPVSFNAKGDWWKWILRVMSKVLPVAGTILTPLFPAAAPLGVAAGQAFGAAPAPSQLLPKKETPARRRVAKK